MDRLLRSIRRFTEERGAAIVSLETIKMRTNYLFFSLYRERI